MAAANPGRPYPFPANGTGFVLSPIIWGAWFVVLYSVQGAGCAAGLDTMSVLGVDALRLVLGLLTGAAAVAYVVIGAWAWRSFERVRVELEPDWRTLWQERRPAAAFLARGAAWNAALFLVATLWIGAPVVMMDACARYT